MNNCFHCGKKTKNPKFCSISCSAKEQAKTRPVKDKKRCCNYCGKIFQYKELQQKFCSKSCSAIFNNLKRSKGDSLVGVCEFCKKNIYGYKKKYNKFCSAECSQKNRKKETVDAWKNNPNSATQIQGLSRSIKIYLIEKSANKCSECGWNRINPITKKSPLEVDHIDGDCYNNSPDNLRVLCPNCHSLTPTYKALNKNGKRKYR